MRITDSTVATAGSHFGFSYKHTAETLKVWVSPQLFGASGSNNIIAAPSKALDNVSPQLSALINIPQKVDTGGGMADLAKLSENHAKSIKSVDSATTSDEELEGADPRLQILIRIFEKITGRKFNFINFAKLKEKFDKAAAKIQNQTAKTPPAQTEANPPQVRSSGDSPEFGLEYVSHTIDYEYERTNFAAAGTVRTSDGRTIGFKLDLEMTREFMQETGLDISAGNAVKKDPLVINYDGGAADLTDTTFQFDLNSDGTAENINFPTTGSGFLVFDKNNDGFANNGAELFGAASGDGFKELSALDTDRNDWLDEADPAFGNLKIWSKDSGGIDNFSTLNQKNIGALYLKSAKTPFAIKSGDGNEKGETVSSGIFLRDDGGVGSIQQLNLLV